VFFRVFTQTTHVVAAPHGFACVGIPATRLYIPSFIEIRSWVSDPQGVKIWPFPLLWLFAFTTSRDNGHLYRCRPYRDVINMQLAAWIGWSETPSVQRRSALWVCWQRSDDVSNTRCGLASGQELCHFVYNCQMSTVPLGQITNACRLFTRWICARRDAASRQITLTT